MASHKRREIDTAAWVACYATASSWYGHKDPTSVRNKIESPSDLRNVLRFDSKIRFGIAARKGRKKSFEREENKNKEEKEELPMKQVGQLFRKVFFPFFFIYISSLASGLKVSCNKQNLIQESRSLDRPRPHLQV